MATNGGHDKVTNKQLYDELNDLRKELPGRREIYAVIASALVLGQIAARLDLSSVRLPIEPVQTALALIGF